MPGVDGRGQLMGRVNLIDAAIAVFVLAAIPTAFVAYRMLRVPAPIITSVTPDRLAADGPLEVRVTGERFRPFLRAYVSPAGTHLTAEDLRDDLRANYLIATPSAVELKVPPGLRAGVYDVYLFDEGREVAHHDAAFTLTPAVVRVSAIPVDELATFDIHVRFTVDPDVLPSVRVGDTDLNQPANGAPSQVSASLLAWRPAHGAGETLRPRLPNGVLPLMTVLPEYNAVVRLGVVRRQGVWGYNNVPIRVGELFSFATSTYLLRGVVTEVARAADASGGTARR
jgi:hypothetical protein